jgi:secreted trypsin-like serine protease
VRQLTETEFPYVVALSRINNNDPSILNVICIGTLITKKDVLTCEHCLEDEEQTEIQIIAGSYDITCGLKYTVYWWLTHDQWAVQMYIPLQFTNNDIAIIRVKYL